MSPSESHVRGTTVHNRKGTRAQKKKTSSMVIAIFGGMEKTREHARAYDPHKSVGSRTKSCRVTAVEESRKITLS